MSNTWKVGTRWGNMGESVFGLFLDYGIIFVGGTDDGNRQGDYSAVREGDLFLIADGATAVAIGIAKSGFQSLGSSGIKLRVSDKDRFFDSSTVVCKAEIKLLKEPQQWGFDARKRFCKNKASEGEVKHYWQNILETDNSGKFDIQSRTASLFPNEEFGDAVFEPNIRYRIPIYQRPYSWGDAEITRLFQDIIKGIREDDALFMGTMQLSAPAPLDAHGKQRRYDIIDGQQRITTFLLMARILELIGCKTALPMKPDIILRTLVEKGQAQADLDCFLNADLEKIRNSEYDDNAYLRNASVIH